MFIDFASWGIKDISYITESINKYLKDFDSSKILSYPNSWWLEELKSNIKTFFDIKTPILIASSSTEALFLLFSDISKNSKKIWIQYPFFFWIQRQLNELNINYIYWDTIEKLEEIINNEKIDYLYLNSNFNSLCDELKTIEEFEQFSKLCKKNNITIIEDNPYDALYFYEKPLRFIDIYENTIYISSFSKIIWPWLRIGFIAWNKELINKLKSLKITINLSTQSLDQHIIYNIISEEFLANIRSIYRNKWFIFKKYLDKLGFKYSEVKWWIFVKILVDNNKDILILISKAKEKWILFEENKFYYPDNLNRQFLRLNFINNSDKINIESLNILHDLLIK